MTNRPWVKGLAGKASNLSESPRTAGEESQLDWSTAVKRNKGSSHEELGTKGKL